MSNFLIKPQNPIGYDLVMVLIIVLFLWLCPMILALFIILSFLLLFVSFFTIWHMPWGVNYQPMKWLTSFTTFALVAGILVFSADTRFYELFDGQLSAQSCPSEQDTCVGGSDHHSTLNELYHGPSYKHGSHLSKYFDYKKYF